MMEHFAKAKIFLRPDFSDGLSRFVQEFGELALD
jgi:hypothetical protein